jgi:small subunit ribosomal protein S16
MPVKLRLARRGAKKRPFYRIVAANSENRRDGRFLEIVGTYNPLTNPPTVTMKLDRVRDWLAKGAIPTETVSSLIKKETRKAVDISPAEAEPTPETPPQDEPAPAVPA